MKVFLFWLVLLLAPLVISTHAAGAKKILHVSSYHQELPWTAGISTGIREVIAAHPEVTLRTFYMDTKRDSSDTHKKYAVRQARKLIEEFEPDLIISSDDNAAKYLIAPYYKNSKTPVVFCGINWSADEYGFPSSNVTGMIEVQLIDQIINHLVPYAKGERIAFLKGDDYSTHKEAEFFEKAFNIKLDKRFVHNFKKWKEEYLDIQNTADMLLLGNPASISGWNAHSAQSFVDENTKIPSGNWDPHMAPYSLITLATIPEEQGEWAARTAIDILAGKPLTDIALVTNKRARIILNMKLAQQLGIHFPGELLEIASFISAKKSKVFYVNSYHKGYVWSDEIEQGLFKALQITERQDGTLDLDESKVDFRLLRLDSKLNRTEEFIKRAALKARQVIDAWKPDVLIVSDDSAVKYLIAPFYKHAAMPVVYCGVNADATIYELPADHITGMIEINPVEETISLLQSLTTGKRLGYIGEDTLSANKTLDGLRGQFDFTDGALVSTFSEWEAEYRRMQKSVDMLLWFSPVGIGGWNRKQAMDVIRKYTKIPTGTTHVSAIHYTLLGRVKVAKEFGWWAGRTAIRIIDGEPLTNIPITTNKRSKVYLNMKLAAQLGVVFPFEILEGAIFLDQEYVE